MINHSLTYLTGRPVAEVRADLARVLAQPETRANNALKFYYSFMDEKMNEKAINRFSEFIDVIEHNCEPYELY